jgi:DNA primase catalytic core
MISKETINRVNEVDIVDIVKPYVNLSKRGRNFVGLCPFHSERTGSFSVDNQKNLFYCFGCRRGGSGIDFIMEKESLSFVDAVEYIARQHNIPVENIAKGKTDEEMEDIRHKESLLAAIEMVQKFFVEQLRTGISDEFENARKYAYGRWSEEFCCKSGIGYAPKYGGTLLDYCKRVNIPEDALLHLGLIRKGENGGYYAFFRERITIPVKDRRGRIIAFTCRTLSNDKSVPKYLNSINSDIFVKGDNLFGIDRAARAAKSKDYCIIVEGAPDVLRLQSIGLENTVATLGTSWSDDQFSLLKMFTSSVCFIPDTDVKEPIVVPNSMFKSGKDKHKAVDVMEESDIINSNIELGAGFKAVLANGAEAMRNGFDVTVRELPYHCERQWAPRNQSDIEEDERKLLCSKVKEAKKLGLPKEEISAISLSDADKKSIPQKTVVNTIYSKNDADSHITSLTIFQRIPEMPFIVWMARKRFDVAFSLTEERQVISDVCDLLRLVKNKLLVDSCIEELGKIHGKAKQWRTALDHSRSEAKRNAERLSLSESREKEKELLLQFNLSIIDNCYYTFDGDDEPTRLSNFILEPLYHIQDDTNGTRIFRMINKFGDIRVIELRESELCSIAPFQQRVGSLGNFVWRARADKLNNVKEFTYALTDSAERIKKLGWDAANEMYAFGNGVFIDGEFKPVDDMGIVRNCHSKTFYLPATSKMYKNNPEIFQFERLMIYENNSGVKLCDFATKLIDVFGDNAKIAICYLFSTLYRDVIFARTRHYPILNLFGEKGTGKTTLATSLQSFFVHSIDPPNLAVTSIPSMNDKVSQAVNTLVVFDEYKNDLDVRKIAFLKGLWGGGGQTKKNTNADGMAAQTIVTTGVAICGQDKPTQDMALYTRLIFLAFTKTSFSQEERKKYEQLVAMCNLGLSHLAIEVLSHRELFEKNFYSHYSLVKKEFADKLAEEEIHDRIFGNWVIPLATFRTLEVMLDLPFSYADLLEVALKGVRNQNEFAMESSEVADFWNTLQGLQTAGKCVDKAHYRIRYQMRFRALNMEEDMEFSEARPILYLNAAAVATLINARTMNSTANRSNWSTTISYLKSHPSFLGLKQDRFNILLPSGAPDLVFENINGKSTKRVKVSRPKALCFDYLKLKEAFGLTLETEIVSDDEASVEDADEQGASSNPQDEATKDAPKPVQQKIEF